MLKTCAKHALIATLCGWVFQINVFADDDFKIAFGACLHQDKPQLIWNSIRQQNPDLFVFMGDNIYADTDNAEVMAMKYQRLADHSEFKTFRKNVPIYASLG